MKSKKLAGCWSGVALLTFALSGISSEEVRAEQTGSVKPSQTPAQATAPKPGKTNNLYRADFKLSGASCVACVRRCGRILRSQKGVVKADVSIFKPHWGIVIYDKDATSMDRLYDVLKKQEKVKFEDIEDQKISEVPLIVIPKGMKIDTPTAGKH